MRRSYTAGVVALSMVFGFAAAPALAAPCRGPNGKFIKCAAAAPKKAVRCKGANGKFAKCGTAGAKPV